MSTVFNKGRRFGTDTRAARAVVPTAFLTGGVKMSSLMSYPHCGRFTHASATWATFLVAVRALRYLVDNSPLKNGSLRNRDSLGVTNTIAVRAVVVNLAETPW